MTTPQPDLAEVVGELGDAVGLIEAAIDNEAPSEPNAPTPRNY